MPERQQSQSAPGRQAPKRGARAHHHLCAKVCPRHPAANRGDRARVGGAGCLNPTPSNYQTSKPRRFKIEHDFLRQMQTKFLWKQYLILDFILAMMTWMLPRRQAAPDVASSRCPWRDAAACPPSSPAASPKSLANTSLLMDSLQTIEQTQTSQSTKDEVEPKRGTRPRHTNEAHSNTQGHARMEVKAE